MGRDDRARVTGTSDPVSWKHYGWVIVAACLVVGVAAYGTYFSYTLFYTHLIDEFGWSHTAVSGAMSVGLVAYAVFALPMGWCVDRFGPRLTVAGGGLLFGCATMLASQVSEIWHLYALYGGLMAVGMGAAWAPLVSTISRWFTTRRGLAVGIGSLGGGTGTFFIVPLATELIQTVGWREAYFWLGMVAAGLIAGAAMLMYRDPEARCQLPHGGASEPATGTRDRPDRHDVEFDGLKSIVSTWLFWRMAIVFGFWWFGGAIIYIHHAPFMLELGSDMATAALAIVALSAASGVGKIAWGVLADRFGAVRAYQSSMFLAAAAMLGLVFVSDISTSIAIAAVFGRGFGGASTQLTTVAVGLFGTRSAGVMMGAILALVGIVGAGGPVTSGILFDATGSYTPGYITGAVVMFFSILLSVTLRR